MGQGIRLRCANTAEVREHNSQRSILRLVGGLRDKAVLMHNPHVNGCLGNLGCMIAKLGQNFTKAHRSGCTLTLVQCTVCGNSSSVRQLCGTMDCQHYKLRMHRL